MYMCVYIYIHAMNVMFAENSCLLSLARWYALVGASTSTSSCPSSCGHMCRCRFGLNLGRRRCHRWKRYFFGYIPWPLQLHFFIQHHPTWPINFWSYTDATPYLHFFTIKFSAHQLRASTGGVAGNDLLNSVEFRWLLIDEATQATEPAALIPICRTEICLVTWCCWNDLRKHLCEFDHGDHDVFPSIFWVKHVNFSFNCANDGGCNGNMGHHAVWTALSKTIGLGILGVE